MVKVKCGTIDVLDIVKRKCDVNAGNLIATKADLKSTGNGNLTLMLLKTYHKINWKDIINKGKAKFDSNSKSGNGDLIVN
jgi:hypothetical protein